MTRFEEQLLRLKQCLGVTKDHEIADLLGMSKTAFSNRKQVDSFPAEHVVSLKLERPELDVMYVLTGERWGNGESLFDETMFQEAARSGDQRLMTAVARGAQNYVERLRDAANDPQVRELLAILLWCDRGAVQEVVRAAAKLMGAKPLPFGLREPADGYLLRSMVVLDEAHRSTPVQPSELQSALASAGKIAAPGLTATPSPGSRKSPPAVKSTVRASKKPQRA